MAGQNASAFELVTRCALHHQFLPEEEEIQPNGEDEDADNEGRKNNPNDDQYPRQSGYLADPHELTSAA